VADEQFLDRSYRLATAFADDTAQLWQHLPDTWILPQRSLPVPAVVKATSASVQFRQLADNIQALRTSLERNRFLGLRIRGIGELAVDRLKGAGVSGPVLQGSEHGSGDVQSRLVARLQGAADDVHEAAQTLAAPASVPLQEASWEVPVGEATVRVKGPRGAIGLHLVSAGAEKPSHVEWQRPSAAVLGLLPELLVNQKLADAEGFGQMRCIDIHTGILLAGQQGQCPQRAVDYNPEGGPEQEVSATRPLPCSGRHRCALSSLVTDIQTGPAVARRGLCAQSQGPGAGR